MPKLIKIALVSSCFALVVFAAGCTYEGDDKSKATTKPSANALRDPSTGWGEVNTNVSGGGATNLNNDALKRDIDHFLLK